MLVVIEAGCWCQLRWFKGRLKDVASCPVLALLAGARKPSAGLTSLGGVGSERATRGYRPNPPRYSDAIALDSSWKWTEDLRVNTGCACANESNGTYQTSRGSAV